MREIKKYAIFVCVKQKQNGEKEKSIEGTTNHFYIH